MTEGASQGLFVVIAIIIFEIFIGLSYIVFGENSTLQVGLVDIFESAVSVNFKGVDGGSDMIYTDETLFEFDEASQTITGYTGEDIDIVIPKRINGLEVLKIGFNTFNDKNLESVIIPDTVTTIGTQAFMDNNLQSLYLPDSVVQISYGAFQNNILKEVRLPNNIAVIGRQAFNRNHLESVVIPDSVVTIGVSSFGNNRLLSVILGAGVATIDTGAFNSNNIESIYIPDNVSTLGSVAFRNNNIDSIELPSHTTYDNNTFDDSVEVSRRD